MLVGVVTVYYAPLLLIGGPAYPVVGWRGGALFVVVAAIIGLSTHELIRRLRDLLAERAELLARFERLAKTDALTGLPNRRAWEDALATAFAAARRSDRAVCVAVIDLDNFKALNDRHGHPYGDRVLAACAAAWSAELRPGDLLARLGGEEFGLLLDCPLDAGCAACSRLQPAAPAHSAAARVAFSVTRERMDIPALYGSRTVTISAAPRSARTGPVQARARVAQRRPPSHPGRGCDGERPLGDESAVRGGARAGPDCRR